VLKGFRIGLVPVLLLDETGKPTGVFRGIAVPGGAGNDQDAVLLSVDARCNLPRLQALFELVEFQANRFFEGSGKPGGLVLVQVGGQVLADCLRIARGRSVQNIEGGIVAVRHGRN